MKKLMFLLPMIASVMFATTAMATWSFDISDIEDDGVYELYFLSDEGSISIDSFSLGFGYDQEELFLSSFSFFVPTGFLSLSGGDDSVLGSISDLSAMSFGGAIAPDTILASFTFDVLMPLELKDGIPDFFFADWGTVNNFGINIPGSEVTLYLEDLLASGNLTYGANVDKGIVPIPPAVLLLGGGLLGLVGIRRKTMK